jgi:catechol 2,3-dioxygenase-like lactoylglutathione lyase family enzyme
LALKTAGDGYRWGRVIEAPRKHLHHLTFHCFAEDWERFQARARAQGVVRLEPPAGFEGDGLWFRDYDGLLLKVRVGPKTSPDGKAVVDAPDPASGLRCAPFRSTALKAQPRRLSHILRFTTSVDRAIEFYGSVLGMRLSDRSGDGIAFLHGIHGSDHHMLAFVKSGQPGLHHLSWDMPSLDSVGLGAMGMQSKGYAQGWGFGRHVLGSNYFYYARDPWGSYSEFSCGIDYIPADMDWVGLDHPPEDSFYLWGPDVPPEFVVNSEAG